MAKRAIDLSLQELAAMGANAALEAAANARDADLVVTGTVDFLDDGQSASSLAKHHPSGAVTLLDRQAGKPQGPDKSPGKSRGRRGAAG